VLGSKFSEIFAHFGRKIGTFLKNQCHDPNFTKISSVVNKNDNFSAKFLG
jgi:hypothetical protein